jgi:hypothetical protein
MMRGKSNDRMYHISILVKNLIYSHPLVLFISAWPRISIFEFSVAVRSSNLRSRIQKYFCELQEPVIIKFTFGEVNYSLIG